MSEVTGSKRQREYEDGASRVSRSMTPSDGGSDRENGYSSDEGGANWKKARFDQAQTPGPDLADISFLIIHEVRCGGGPREHRLHPNTATFFDHPRLDDGDCRYSPLHGNNPFPEPLDEYLRERPEIVLTVIKRYDCVGYHELLKDKFQKIPLPYLSPEDRKTAAKYFSMLQQQGPRAPPSGEQIESMSPALKSAIKQLEAHDPETFAGWDLPQHLRAPYVHFYHVRDAVHTTAAKVLDESGMAHISLLFSYLETAFGQDYQDATALFERGMVTLSQLPKLFRANDIVVSLEEGQPRAYRTTDSPTVRETSIFVPCTAWNFDGVFKRTSYSFTVVWPLDEEGEIPIASLGTYPLRYDQNGLREKLLKRGVEFWSCRKRRFISYASPRRTFEIRVVNPRYMVDMQTYKHLHDEPDTHTATDPDALDLDLMDSDSPPDDEFAIQLPPRILGFGLHDKKWRYLLVDDIQEIHWNKSAFDRLVLDPDKKSLITAMVKEHVLSDVSADVIEGKGNGLIILLHGGPGTGKTLTAESVAELAEKPLYRVTCGDIGTDAEAVEKYLESVLYIGTIWKAVVLFDESDVFLEERSQADLQRNALVSVFLRVLEYYDGILILTSNRVGTFDEAFKSRVQLALHYPAIDEQGRGEIWHDFIQELQKQGANANYDLLKSKVSALARDNLNGRQIRNSIRTARQLASQAKEPLSYDHLRKAIKVAQEFEQYVIDTHGGQTHEAFARAQHVRVR